MENIKSIRSYLTICVVFILLGLLWVLMSNKTDIHLVINGAHNQFLDEFFRYFTHVGDGAVTAIAILPLGVFLWKRYKYTPLIIGWGTLILCGVFAQFMKRVIFPDAARPLKYFGENMLYLVPDVDVHMSNSFPSGHTTTAFGFFAFMAYYFGYKKPWLQILFAACAVLVGYSRMYLSQHFMEDVIVGGIIGLSAFLLISLTAKPTNRTT